MTAYCYRAARADGTIVRGRLQAASLSRANASLTESGLFALSLGAARTEARARPAGRRDLAVMLRNIASLVEAGVSVEPAIAASEPVTGRRLRDALVVARTRLREGATVGEAFAASNGIIPSAVVDLVRAGERGSQLGAALCEAADQMEHEAEIVSRIRSALAYPAVLSAVGITSVVIIGAVVVPRFAILLQDLGEDLPFSTQLLLYASHGLARYGLPAAAVGAIGAFALYTWRQTPPGRLHLDTLLLRLPVVGAMRLSFASARTCRALGGMLRTGMPLLSALDAASPASGDAAVAQRLSLTRERVARGERLASSLERERALAPRALQLVAVGEASGRLALMAKRAGDLESQEAERLLKTLVNLLEPGLVVVLGGLVAFAAAALLQAVYGIRPGMG